MIWYVPCTFFPSTPWPSGPRSYVGTSTEYMQMPVACGVRSCECTAAGVTQVTSVHVNVQVQVHVIHLQQPAPRISSPRSLCCTPTPKRCMAPVGLMRVASTTAATSTLRKHCASDAILSSENNNPRNRSFIPSSQVQS